MFAACASASTSEPALEPTAAPADDSPKAQSVSTVIGTPVPRSDVGTVFAEPLSSGLSVADVTENALPSVVQIIAGSGSGTGFIINENGLTVTNRHVVEGNNQVAVRLATGEEYQGIVTERHPSLDLAYVEIDANRRFTPIAIGNSDNIRVGEDVIAIGFPLGRSLGLEPTVSVGIISAKRNNRLQTDASLNPGNSGGPLLDMFGQVAGVVVSRVETNKAGRPVTGIGFAIPINAVKSGLGGQVSRVGKALPTPTLTPFPAIALPPNVEATKAAMDAMGAHRRQVEQATRTAIEAQQETERYAASLEATRHRRTAHANSHAAADGYPDADTYAFAHSHADSNAHANTGTHANPTTHANTGTHANTASTHVLPGMGSPGAGLDKAGQHLYF